MSSPQSASSSEWASTTGYNLGVLVDGAQGSANLIAPSFYTYKLATLVLENTVTGNLTVLQPTEMADRDGAFTLYEFMQRNTTTKLDYVAGIERAINLASGASCTTANAATCGTEWNINGGKERFKQRIGSTYSDSTEFVVCSEGVDSNGEQTGQTAAGFGLSDTVYDDDFGTVYGDFLDASLFTNGERSFGIREGENTRFLSCPGPGGVTLNPGQHYTFGAIWAGEGSPLSPPPLNPPT